MKVIKKITLLILLFFCLNSIKIVFANTENKCNFIEVNSICSLEDDEYISVIIKFNYNFNEVDFFYKNKQIFESLNLDENIFEISKIGPFLFGKYFSYNEYIMYKDFLIHVSNNEYIEYIYVEKILLQENKDELLPDVNLEGTPLNFIKSMLGVFNSSYTGFGIKIGIIESGIPKYLNNFDDEILGDMLIYEMEPGKPLEKEHASAVGSIVGGTYGIAYNAELFFATYNELSDNNTLDSIVEWLIIENDVDIINISLYTGSSNMHGIYSGHSAYIDFISWYYKVIFVKASGNVSNTNPNGLITNPGLGFNVITVGAVDIENKVLDSSCYSTDDSYSSFNIKPTIVAPGNKIIVPNSIEKTIDGEKTITDFVWTGTSFSTPMVTGIIALLMEEFPNLKENPAKIISTILVSAEILPNKSDIWNEDSGAGLIDYQKAREVLAGSYYAEALITNETNHYNPILVLSYSLPSMHSLEFSLVSTLTNGVNILNENTIIPNISNYMIEIFDVNENTGEIISSQGNIILDKVENLSEEAKNIAITVYLNGEKQNDYDEYLSFSAYLNDHIHDYSSYVQVDKTGHKELCECGHYYNRPHVIREEDLDERYVNCIDCNYLLDLYFDIVNIRTTSYLTQNGSYYIGNNLIVLKEADEELYLKGELKLFD